MKFRAHVFRPRRPYAGVAFEPRSRASSIPTVGDFRSQGRHGPGGLESGRGRRPGAEVLPQGGRAQGRHARLDEEGVPDWLQRSVGDEAALEALAARRAVRRRTRRAASLQPHGGLLDVLGLEVRLLRFRKRRADLLRRDVRDARAADRRAELAAVVQHRLALGVRHLRPGARTLVRRRRRRRKRSPRPTRSRIRRSRACFILGIEDDLVNEGGIFDGVIREARIFKGGSGSGANFSKIRAAGEKLTGGGTSSGLMSFLKVFDRAAGAIKSGGTTRRAAKMVVLNADHPDIEDFVNWKVREERKVADLVIGSRMFEKHLNAIIAAAHDTRVPEQRTTRSGAQCLAASRDPRGDAAGIPSGAAQNALDYARQGYTRLEVEQYDTGWDSEAYVTVSGQNSNNSVRLTNAFFNALDHDDDWQLTARTTGDVVKTIKARDLWEQIGACRMAVRRSRPAVRRHDSRVAHVCRTTSESMQRIRAASTSSSTIRLAISPASISSSF